MRSKAVVAARVVLVGTGVITVVVGTSAAFVEGGGPDGVLAASFAAGMGILVIAAALLATAREPVRLAWVALWYLPVFFVIHLVAFRAIVPDLPLLVLDTAALLVTARHVAGRRTAPQPT